ncbi:MAG: hypothetical protein JRG97_14130 [Deltaproteobacteria bacterium]|nr:hypothetical protein [Deltaproteobacteria bacterium]
MDELKPIINQVLRNCDISDARYAGNYSICGLALRLRDLYKWEKGLEPWMEKDFSEISGWVENKERQWDKLTEKELDEIIIEGVKYDPFDTLGINAVLEPDGIFYGGGYARNLKPTFFLAALEDKKEINGHTVYILGHELARDLFTAPALSQDDCVVVRQESAEFIFWDQIFFIRKSSRRALNFALKNCGLKSSDLFEIQHGLKDIVAAEKNTYIYHELGEMRDDVFHRDTWREIIASYPHTPVELLARTVKDLLADTNEYGTLQYIIRERKAASLAYYVAFLNDFTKKLFPELIESFQKFTQTLNWGVIEQAVSAGFNTAKRHAQTICRIYGEAKESGEKKK